MTGNKSYLVEYQEFKGGSVAFGGSKGQITGKGKIRSGKLDFKDVYFVKELQHFNLFSMSQMCDKKNKVLFTDTECLVLSPDFKLPNENQVLLRVPRQNNMYSFNLENIVPTREFKNRDIIEFCGSKGIKREYSNARTPQQNGVAKRKNRTLIEATRTMLADSFLPNTFWAEAVSIACYVLNRVLVTKPQNKTPYELITGKIPIISYIRPFGCHVTILNTIDHLGKFEEKFDEGFLVGYSLNSKAFRLYNLETKRVEENLHINFLENKPNVEGKGPNWLFDLDYITDSMNYHPVTAENKANKTAGPKEANNSAGTQDNIDAGYSEMKAKPAQEYFILPLWSSYTSTVKSSEAKNGGEKPNGDTCSKINEEPEFAQGTEDLLLQAGAARASSTNYVNTASTPVNTASPSGNIPGLEDIYEVLSDGIFTSASYDDEGAMADFTNLESTVNILVDLPFGKKAIRTKWVYRNKKDEICVVVRNKARLVAQGHRQEEGIDYDEVFVHVARIEAIRIFLAFASYMGFIVYQMDVKSAFLYGTIYEEVYVSQPPGFIDHKFPKKVYKVVKAMYCLHQAPRAWYATLSSFLEKSGYIRGTIDKTLFIKRDKKDIMLVQVYVADIIFGSTKKSWCDEFEALIKSRFQISSMGELTFFLRLQVKQKEDGIFISQDKYVALCAEIPEEVLEWFQSTAQRLHIFMAVNISLGTQRPNQNWVFGYPQRECKKQTFVATSTTEAEYVTTANYCGQVLWIQNQMLEYGFNFMNTNIYIDNESIICIVKNPMFYSKTKHIEIRHHFIRDAYEKKLIQVLKIHTDDNVADLLTKAFDGRKNAKPGSTLDDSTFDDLDADLAHDWKYDQERWSLKSWDFYKNCLVHTLILEDGTEIHMLAERKYPLTKETLKRMMSLKLIAESASDGTYNLLRFIQKQIDESRSYDGSEKDL
ncbi:retrovirus-related pol polyprotein from transposon TNT 1-94 [Tanacetum coccineum]|uniref:Retrovirus-related pol polyprotein from transposon TNT 1-94 n=1 Tax=Tanacetum coccineum TaxID=301880 RepID=A0ABQ4ZUZ0_9ASTR